MPLLRPPPPLLQHAASDVSTSALLGRMAECSFVSIESSARTIRHLVPANEEAVRLDDRPRTGVPPPHYPCAAPPTLAALCGHPRARHPELASGAEVDLMLPEPLIRPLSDECAVLNRFAWKSACVVRPSVPYGPTAGAVLRRWLRPPNARPHPAERSEAG